MLFCSCDPSRDLVCREHGDEIATLAFERAGIRWWQIWRVPSPRVFYGAADDVLTLVLFYRWWITRQPQRWSNLESSRLQVLGNHY